MVDWTSTEEIAVDGATLVKLGFVVAGIYFWEFSISFAFDWSFITGARKFKWPMIFYFCNRYLFLASLCALCAFQSITRQIACQPLLTFMQFAGNMSIGFSSINLCIRTMAIWSQNRWIVIPLVILILGHWSLILQGTLLFATWIPGQGCVITHTKIKVMIAQFIYSVCLDLIVLLLAAWKLPQRAHSKLGSILFRDGLIYFVFAFLGNLLVVTFELLNLNPVMNVIFNVPSVLISTVAATRAVRNLATHIRPGVVELRANSKLHTTEGSSEFFGIAHATRTAGRSAIAIRDNMSAGVRVQMETFQVSDCQENESGKKENPMTEEV